MDDSVAHRGGDPPPEVLLALRLIPGVGNALAQYVIDRGERRTARVEEFIADASADAALDPEELLRRIMDDPRLSELFENAVGFAVVAASDRKRRAMAKLLATGVLAEDDAEVDFTELLLNAVARLEVAELKLLETMRQPPQDVRGHIPIGTPMNIELLTALYRGSPHAVETLVAKLEGAGLIKDISSGKVGEQSWVISSFGQTVYTFIEEASTQDGG